MLPELNTGVIGRQRIMVWCLTCHTFPGLSPMGRAIHCSGTDPTEASDQPFLFSETSLLLWIHKPPIGGMPQNWNVSVMKHLKIVLTVCSPWASPMNTFITWIIILWGTCSSADNQHVWNAWHRARERCYHEAAQARESGVQSSAKVWNHAHSMARQTSGGWKTVLPDCHTPALMKTISVNPASHGEESLWVPERHAFQLKISRNLLIFVYQCLEKMFYKFPWLARTLQIYYYVSRWSGLWEPQDTGTLCFNPNLSSYVLRDQGFSVLLFQFRWFLFWP